MTTTRTWPEMSENEARDFFAHIYRGKHHIPGELRRDSRATWSVCHFVGGAGVATFDYDELTRMVFAAHDACMRLAILAAGPRHVRIQITKRTRNGSEMAADHPTLEDALDKWRNEDDRPWVRRWADRAEGEK
jgi:hypothetical protein